MYDRFGAYRVPFILIATLVTLALLPSLGFRMAPAGRPPAR
jgi:hypothetical protein